MRAFLLTLLVAGAAAQFGPSAPAGSCSKSCPANHRCEVQTCEVCVEEDPTCETHVCKENFKCVDKPSGPVCVPNSCTDVKCSKKHKCVENSELGAQCVPKDCSDITCKRTQKCIETEDGPKCVKKDCDDIDCPDTHKCVVNFRGPQCVPKTCADIKCAAGEICDDGPDGPDCVPDVPSCKGFYCPRGTNCYIREGAPKCLPNTCLVRVCTGNLVCIDTPSGALCRRGQKKRGCQNKYCPPNSQCVDDETGTHCQIS